MSRYSLRRLFRLRCRIWQIPTKFWFLVLLLEAIVIAFFVGAVSSFSLIVYYAISPDGALEFVNEQLSTVGNVRWSLVLSILLVIILRDAFLYWRFPNLRMPKTAYDEYVHSQEKAGSNSRFEWKDLLKRDTQTGVLIGLGGAFCILPGYSFLVGWSGNESVSLYSFLNPPIMAFGEEFILTNSVPGADIPSFVNFVYLMLFAGVTTIGAGFLFVLPFTQFHIPVPIQPRHLPKWFSKRGKHRVSKTKIRG